MKAERDPVIKKGRIGIQSTGLTQQHLCACPLPGPRFQTLYVIFPFFLFQDLW
jgi:hypothetical protein